MIELSSIKTVNFNTHFIGKVSGELSQFLLPLKNKLAITDFSYAKLYPDRTETFLTTRPDFSELFVKEKFYLLSTVSDIDQYNEGYYLFMALPQQNPLMCALKEKNMPQGLTVIKRNANAVELFFFASSHNNPMINNYFINHINLFESAISTFKEQCAPLIAQADQHRLLLPNHCQEILYSTQTVVDSDKTEPEDNIPHSMINEESLHSYLLCSKSLTPREADCVMLSIKGLGAKNISKTLRISHRTVEKNFENIKKKLNCHTRYELNNYFLKTLRYL